jgi:predicted ABC-type ATPase
VWIVNPDLLTVRLRNAEGLPSAQANLQAVQRLETWLDATLRVHQSVGVETVLSTGKYRRLVDLAKTLGFMFRLFYVMLESPDLNVERVRDRVAKGGHDVPQEKIRERYWRSLEQLPWFFDRADIVDIYDNSTALPRRVGGKGEGKITLSSDAPINLVRALTPLPK